MPRNSAPEKLGENLEKWETEKFFANLEHENRFDDCWILAGSMIQPHLEQEEGLTV